MQRSRETRRYWYAQHVVRVFNVRVAFVGLASIGRASHAVEELPGGNVSTSASREWKMPDLTHKRRSFLKIVESNGGAGQWRMPVGGKKWPAGGLVEFWNIPTIT